MRFTIKIFCFCYFILINHSAYAEKNIDFFLNYFETLQNVAIDFRQIDSRGNSLELSSTEGKLLISKPHKFRVNYYAPYPLLLLGNKSELILYDYSLEQTTRISPQENIFNFLLIDKPNWNKNFEISDIVKKNNQVHAVLYNENSGKKIMLSLSEKPTQLKQITILENDGNEIVIFIDKISHIKSFNNKLFSLPNTEIFGKPKRLSAKDLMTLCN